MERWKIEYFHLIIITANICIGTMFIKTPSKGRLLCKHNVTIDHFHRAKWFKSSRDDVFEKGGPALVSWDGTSQRYTTYNYGIDEDYSLIIFNTSIHDEGVYRCQIIRNVEPFSFVYDVSLRVYALPWKAPLIQLVNDTFINCSLDRVYPLLYPHVEFKHETYAVKNEDGTYNTSVSGSIQGTRSSLKAVDCSFPYFNYSETSSLSLCPTTTSLSENDDEPYFTVHTEGPITDERPIPETKKSVPVALPILMSVAILVAVIIIQMFRRKYYKFGSHGPIRSLFHIQ